MDQSSASRDKLLNQLRRLKQLRIDTDMLYFHLEQELTTEANRLKNGVGLIDAVGTVSTVAVSLAALVRKSFLTLNLAGPALEKANQELAKDGLHIAYDPARDVLADKAGESLSVHPGISHYFGTALHVFANLATPSYWAAVYTNARDGKALDQIVNSSTDSIVDDSLRQLREHHHHTIEGIDRAIRGVQALL